MPTEKLETNPKGPPCPECGEKLLPASSPELWMCAGMDHKEVRFFEIAELRKLCPGDWN